MTEQIDVPQKYWLHGIELPEMTTVPPLLQAFTALLLPDEEELGIAEYGQEELLLTATVFTFALSAAPFSETALVCTLFEAGTAATECTTAWSLPELLLGRTASAVETELFVSTSEDVWKDVRLEVADFPAVGVFCVCAAAAKTATPDTIARLRSTGTTRFLVVLFISHSPFCKRLFKLYFHNTERATPIIWKVKKETCFLFEFFYWQIRRITDGACICG